MRCPKCDWIGIIIKNGPDAKARCLACDWEGSATDCFSGAFEELALRTAALLKAIGMKQSEIELANAHYQLLMEDMESLKITTRTIYRTPIAQKAFLMGFHYGRKAQK